MPKRTNQPELQGFDRPPGPADQVQRDSIANDLDCNLLVEAGAGTGKTTSLVARMINLIKKDKCPIENLAAVTFTRKAAAELRSRFQIGLEEAARESSGSERERLAKAVARIERCFLGTIHSFCARLLRERPVEAGVDSEFTELEEDEDQELRRRAWAQWVERMIFDDDPLVAQLEELGLEFTQLEPAFEQFADYPDVEEWPAAEITPPDLGPVVGSLRDYLSRIQALEPSLPREPKNDKLITEYRRLLLAARQTDFRRAADLFELLVRFEKATPKVVQKEWPGGKAQAVDEERAWAEFAVTHAAPFLATWRAVRYRAVMRAMSSAVETYDHLRRAAGALNFQDLLLSAARLLREHPAVRTYLRARFTHLLIDEFQDTDPIQAEVMLLLTADDPSLTNWRRCRPVPGSLFVVGDPKQSIYRFRRADIVTYNEVKEIIAGNGGRVLALTANFRTTAPLVGWINHTFAGRFPAEATETAPRHSPLVVGRVDALSGDLAGLYRMNAQGKNKDEILAHEPALVARTIRHALDSPLSVPRSSRESRQPPSAQPGDFLIVTRNTTNLSRYAGELQALGVPHQVTGGSALNGLAELSLLATCLRAVARPDDPLALVAVLRSELFGLSDAALYAFRRAGGRFNFRSSVPTGLLTEEDEHALADAFRRLNRYYAWLFVLPPVASIEKIAADLGLAARSCIEPGAQVGAGSLGKVCELARLAQSDQPSVMGVVEFLERLVATEEKHDAIAARPHKAAVVRVMNLHKVKGLEAPVVFLADPTGHLVHPVALHIDRSADRVRGYMAVYEPNESFGPRPLLACPHDWNERAAREREFQQAEENRLLYVAATRAGTCLMVSGRDTLPNQDPWHSFTPDLGDCPVYADPGPQTAPVRASVVVTPHDVEAAREAIEDRWQEIRQKTYVTEAIKEWSLKGASPAVTTPVSDAAASAGLKRVSQLAEGDPLRRAGQPPSDTARQSAAADRPPRTTPVHLEEVAPGEHGVEWGEDLHSLLEAAMKQSAADLEGLARSLTREREGDQSRVEALVASARAVQQSVIWKRAQVSRRVLVEVPLLMQGPSRDSLPSVHRGVIDLVFREANGWVIVDYKTDIVERSDLRSLIEHYRPQVEAYAAAWRALQPEPVHEIGLFLTRLNDYVPLSH
jgi:ATP-dependent helicase/nuclease subunit A